MRLWDDSLKGVKLICKDMGLWDHDRNLGLLRTSNNLYIQFDYYIVHGESIQSGLLVG